MDGTENLAELSLPNQAEYSIFLGTFKPSRYSHDGYKSLKADCNNPTLKFPVWIEDGAKFERSVQTPNSLEAC
jgi:hypothetical protein